MNLKEKLDNIEEKNLQTLLKAFEKKKKNKTERGNLKKNNDKLKAESSSTSSLT